MLSGVDHILAEDTRQTAKLLSAYDIKAPLSAYHDHNAADRVPGIIKRLQDGDAIALVSDAGTPLVSDPGFKLVQAAVQAGIDIIPLPGASAPLAALVKSGLPSDKFLFAGFLPPKSTARKTALSALENLRATLIFFETGPRIAAMMADAKDILGDRPAVLTRELTKHYEEARHGTLSDLISSANDTPPKGEIVLLIAPPDKDTKWDEMTVTKALLDQIPELGVKKASAAIADMSGWPKRDIYQLALSLK